MRWLALLFALTIAPAVASPADRLTSAEFSSGDRDPVPSEPWWSRMGDPALSAYVGEALRANPDLRRSRALVRQSEGGRLQAASGLSPALNASARTTVAPLESLGFGFGLPLDPTAPKTYAQGGASLDASWQVDPFGGSVATFRAASQDLQASRAELDGAGSSMASLVAEAYFDVVVARERVDLVQDQITSNDELLQVLSLRYERGDASSLDVLQQRQQLATLRAQLPTAHLLAESAAQRLAVLLGRMPTALPDTAERLPDLNDQPAVGRPADLVAHRPDLRAASARLRGARDRRWSATTALLPTVGVQGTAGWQFIDRGEFIDQLYWNAGGTFSVPLFNGGRNLGALQQARASHDVQSAAFEASLLQAVQQVEAALARERRQLEVVQALREQVVAAEQAAQAAREQYLVGLTPYVSVQTAVGRLLSAQLSLLQGRRDRLSARVALYEALGGPWTSSLGERSPQGEE